MKLFHRSTLEYSGSDGKILLVNKQLRDITDDNKISESDKVSEVIKISEINKSSDLIGVSASEQDTRHKISTGLTLK